MFPGQNRNRWFLVPLALVLCAALPASAQDKLTTLVASTLTHQTQAVPGTDGKLHVVYELVLTDTSPTPATVNSIDVVSGANPGKVYAQFSGADLLKRFRLLNNTPASSTQIPANQTRIVQVNFTLPENEPVPTLLLHHFQLLGAPMPGGRPVTPVPLDYTVAPFHIKGTLLTIAPPLSGKGWTAFNGCCEPGSVHRGTGLPVNGKIYFAQRFAIDWMRIGPDGKMVHGDPSRVENYVDYGAPVLAVADATVVATGDGLNEQIPGQLPDPKTINIDNADGNHIILDLGNGVYAMYAHLQKGSLRVKQGDRVHPGQVLALLGNTGNTSGPHLHFQLMSGSSSLGANGLPYKIDSFQVAGHVSREQFDKSNDLEGVWNQGLLPQPKPVKDVLPLDLTIVDFP